MVDKNDVMRVLGRLNEVICQGEDFLHELARFEDYLYDMQRDILSQLNCLRDTRKALTKTLNALEDFSGQIADEVEEEVNKEPVKN